MSAVLCLPACLCVSSAASPGHAPHGNASIQTGKPNVATECHQRTRPLWRRHGDIPRTPHGGIPTTCHDGADCHHRRLQCSPISGRSWRATEARGRSGASGHAAYRPTGPLILSTRPALAQTTKALRSRFPHRPLLRGLGTRRDDTGAIPRPTIQDHRTSTPGDLNQGTSGSPGLQGWYGPRGATTHEAARRARHPQMGCILPHGTTHPRPARQDGPQPRHATSGHGMRPQRTPQNTGRYHPALRPTIHGHNHKARQASTTHSSALV